MEVGFSVAKIASCVKGRAFCTTLGLPRGDLHQFTGQKKGARRIVLTRTTPLASRIGDGQGGGDPSLTGVLQRVDAWHKGRVPPCL